MGANEQMLGNSFPVLPKLDSAKTGNKNQIESTLFNTNLNQSGSGLNLLQSNVLNHSMSLDRVKNQGNAIDFSLGRQNFSQS